MAYDALTMAAVAAELRAKINGARVDRIYQPAHREVLLYLYRQGENFCLLLSADPHHSRVHLSRQHRRHPEVPAPLCMLLRKYLIGGRIAAIEQLPLERILFISFIPPEGRPPTTLVAEIMGRRSNLVLIDDQKRILGAMKIVTGERNRYREILPGAAYLLPPPQEKIDPLAHDEETLARLLAAALQEGDCPWRALQKTVQGLSPQAAREAMHRSDWNPRQPEASARRLASVLHALIAAVHEGKIQPWLYPEAPAFSPFPLYHLADARGATGRPYESVNEALDHFYARLAREEETRQLREALAGTIRQHLERGERKLALQEEELRRAEEAETYRLYGELLYAFPHLVSPGAREVELPHLYRPGETVTVPLDPALSASRNAQKYFNRYRRATKGCREIQRQLDRTREEIRYGHEVLFAVENGDRETLLEIQQELLEAGMLKAQRREPRRKQPLPETKPLVFTSSAGHTILVGRNNRQNEQITFKLSARRDTWLHAKDLPGSHVLIKGVPYPPPAADLEEAALLAAYFSRGREYAAVDVDYTEVRHVRRGPNGRPGFVLYENHRTITVNPADPQIKKLLEQQQA